MITNFSDFKNAVGFEIFEYYRSKNLQDLTIEELAYVHLNIFPGTSVLNNGLLSTCLHDLVETVTTSFGNIRTEQYVPLLGCFSILDQVGGTYDRLDKSTIYKNGIKKALDLYSSYNNPADLESLVTLRHGIFHDGSLVSINKNTGTNVIFRMVVGSGTLLTPPVTVWDGVYRDDLTDYVTKIDLKELQKLTNDVIESCADALLSGNSDIKVSDPREFFYKYLFMRSS